MFRVFRTDGEFFTHLETSLLPLKACDTGQPFIMVLSEDPCPSQLLPSVWHWSNNFGMSRPGIEPRSPHAEFCDNVYDTSPSSSNQYLPMSILHVNTIYMTSETLTFLYSYMCHFPIIQIYNKSFHNYIPTSISLSYAFWHQYFKVFNPTSYFLLIPISPYFLYLIGSIFK